MTVEKLANETLDARDHEIAGPHVDRALDAFGATDSAQFVRCGSVVAGLTANTPETPL